MIERCLPVSSVIDFGGMWEVDGLYSRVCVEKFNIPKVTMIDKFESENSVQNTRLRANIDFRKGDFSDESFMGGLKNHYDLALAYDVLPHQRDPIHTLSLMLSKAERFFLISQAILPEKIMPFRNCLVLLSGSRANRLIPFHEKWTREINYWANFSDATIMDSEHWLWGMTPSFIESLMTSFGWRVIYRESWRGWLPKSSKWELCGLIFARA
ncbi:MAG: class I SAM-dependent methyltransferase [Candidatus Bathyarchaeia archaeon]